MDPKAISAIHDFTLKARELLEKEISEQLEGTYGLLPDGSWKSAESYPALIASQEAKETRHRLEQFLEDENAAGIGAKHAREKLVREAAFTWLNRLVAFKMMEARKLLRQTISRGQQSNAFLMWLTEPGNEENYKKYEQGDLPQNAFGKGPRQEAYRHFLLWQCGQLAREIKVLFDPHSLVSRLFPRPRALNELIDLMNAPDLEQAWAPGNEETIGWVYQFFNEREKKEVFDRLYKKKQKIKKEDIPAATELFTPRWIVKWLVHNSLGRYWIQMHPDSKLSEKLDYLVPLPDDIPKVPLKKAKEIKLLDPACGTMHFGLVAFDIFADMYQEEIENAGKEGWPEQPSVQDPEDIPSAIIANNIHGIDIDLRAVQLSAMTLFLKAKSLNSSAVITESHLACADIAHFDDSKLFQFLKELKLSDSIYSRGLLIEKEKKKFREAQKVPYLKGFAPDQFETEAGEEEFWDIIGSQIIQALQYYGKSMAEKGHDESFFTAEVVKGFQVIDIMTKRYDVVVTNPPYMARRNMGPELAKFLSNQYPNSKGDLYTAFIERCAEFLEDAGRLAMITQQSFMFISSYEKMRTALLDNLAIETVCHVGPRAFESISGEKVNTVLFSMRKEPDAKKRRQAVGTYFRLVKEPDGESKRRRFEKAVKQLRTMNDVYNAERGTMNDEREKRKGKNSSFIVHNSSLNYVFIVNQSSFDSIPGSPWVYWITPGLRRLFEDLPKLQDVAQPRQGLATADNFRFLRYWWEVGTANIGFGCKSADDALATKKKWFPYMKGGSFKRWYGNQEYVVNWREDGAEIRVLGVESGRVASRPQNTDYYFRRGVTFNRISSKIFSARYMPNGFIFDCNGPATFADDTMQTLGFISSTTFTAILSIIAPTITFQVGDVALAPVPKASSETLQRLVDMAISLAKADSEEDETTWDFIAPPDWPDGIQKVAERHAQLAQIEREIDEEVYRLYGISDEDREAIEQELGMMNDER
ncbi:MAG: BREX-1 system adenine-specific DNA-methyltransferase PglX [Deltaproteobacteria bacterium]|nr:BREX-1 system adenine-specific DNA-methyltransferase PglX [Deltaproteobacteria bacterium]